MYIALSRLFMRYEIVLMIHPLLLPIQDIFYFELWGSLVPPPLCTCGQFFADEVAVELLCGDRDSGIRTMIVSVQEMRGTHLETVFEEGRIGGNLSKQRRDIGREDRVGKSVV